MDLFGTTTFFMMTISIVTPNTVSSVVKTFSIMTLRTMTDSIMKLCKTRTTLEYTCYGATTFGAITLSIMTLTTKVLRPRTLGKMKLSTMTVEWTLVQ